MQSSRFFLFRRQYFSLCSFRSFSTLRATPPEPTPVDSSIPKFELSKLGNELSGLTLSLHKKLASSHEAFLKSDPAGSANFDQQIQKESHFYQEHLTLLSALSEYKEEMEQTDDSELREVLEDEIGSLSQTIKEKELDIIAKIIPPGKHDFRNCRLEIRPAAGGTEGALFAEDLRQMYRQYVQGMGWRWKEEFFQADFSIGKGCKLGVYHITGEDDEPQKTKYI